MEAAQEDFRQLLARALAGESGRRGPSIDELPEHVAIVHRSGTIMAVNKAWKRFARNNGAEPSKVVEGVNYLSVCERATGEQSEYAHSFAEGFRSVVSGQEERFAMVYTCHSPTERRWFVGRVLALPQTDLPIALVAHENITGRRLQMEQ
jgi:two-component system, NtrC family, sensor kinase